MIKERVVVIYADTWEELTLKMMGWYHDHCWHYYAGLTADVPEELQPVLKMNDCYQVFEDGHDLIETTDDTATCYCCGEVVKKVKKWVLIAEDDEPYIPEK